MSLGKPSVHHMSNNIFMRNFFEIQFFLKKTMKIYLFNYYINIVELIK